MPWSSKEKQKAYHAEWYRKNRDMVLEKTKAYQKANPHVLKNAYKKRWSDPEYRARVLANNREWAKENPDKARQTTKDWQDRNRELVRQKHREWSKSPEGRKWYQARDHARRAAKAQRTINPKSIDTFIGLVRSKKRVRCYYCQRHVSGAIAHIDHIIPLSKGGAHSVENLCSTCPKCNQTKSAKLLQDFITLGQQLLSL